LAIYSHVLIALDLTEGSEQVARRGLEIARLCQAEANILHVVEYVPVEPMGEALLPAVDIEQELAEGARKRLGELVVKLGAGDVPFQVEVGSIKPEVLRVADTLGADVIVLGSRERHGLAVMLNLAEDTILHAAHCDVLAVRIPE
jgi:universal stress protein A